MNNCLSLCYLPDFPHICTALHFERRLDSSKAAAGISVSVASVYYTVLTPVWFINVPTAVLRCNATGKRNRFFSASIPTIMRTRKPKLIGKDFVSYGHYLLKVIHPDGSRVEAVTGNMDLVERLNSEDKKERGGRE